jgi:hypothetical protein
VKGARRRATNIRPSIYDRRMSNSALAGAREVLSVAGYGDDVVDADYPVWLGLEAGVTTADLVAFGRAAPKDMSTAVITVGQGSVDSAYAIAHVIAAPYFLIAQDRQIDLWVAEPARPVRWREAVTLTDVRELNAWLRPAAALTTKVGLHQPPLFDVPVDFLAAARSDSADRLAPLVANALEAAGESLRAPAQPSDESGRQRHRAAARLVVGALTVLVIRDSAEDRRTLRLLSTDALIQRVVEDHRTTFSWWKNSSPAERSVLTGLVEQLGEHIDYRSLDPAILSEVYEQALVDEDDRKRLGIHYTPPHLARRLLRELPVETIAPDDRHVLDPCCGSGTLLIASHDRLRALQPQGLTDPDRHRDLAVHLHGYDTDPFAAEIARLTLLLHAQPAGNGWHIEQLDTLRQPAPTVAPKLIVTNPPWRFAADGRRAQTADEFLRWSMQALAPGGLLGVLLPASWLSAANSAETRALLTEGFDVFETWRLPQGTFATSRAATAVLLARKHDGLGGHGARVVREVTRSGIGSFLSGESPGDSFWLADASRELTETAPSPGVRVGVRPLEEIADVLSGPQPLKTIADRGHGTPYLNQIREVPPYGIVGNDVLWRVAFPDDFQTARGARILDKKKVLASAAKWSNNPWRFRVAIDTRGIAMRNSMRGVAPHDQDDPDLLFALSIIIGSGFASSYAAAFGGDRNIPARVLKRLPVPRDRDALKRIADLGRHAARLAGNPGAVHALLVEAEQVVWDSYGVSASDRATAMARLGGHPAPEGLPRYPGPSPRPSSTAATLRRVGVVLDVVGNHVLVWVNGLTPAEGVRVPFPAGMPGWLARAGATFDMTGAETVADLPAGRFRFQPMAWQDLDLDSERPEPLLRH